MGFEPKIDILPPAQRNFWQEAPSIPAGFVLYGGTAIAVRLGHRSSEDFDFFSSDAFDVNELLNELTPSRDAEVLQSGQNTLTLRVERGGRSRLTVLWLQEGDSSTPLGMTSGWDRVVLNAMLIQATKPHLFNIVFGEADPPRFLDSARNDKEQAETW